MSMLTTMMMHHRLVFVCSTLLCFVYAMRYNVEIKTVTDTDRELLYETPGCLGRDDELVGSNPTCFSSKCVRRIQDGLFNTEDISSLLAIARKGMATRGPSSGGPTILDINTGYVRDSDGLENLFAASGEGTGDAGNRAEQRIFSNDDFATYGRIIHQLKQHVERTFDITNVHFTAPTFITRLDSGLPVHSTDASVQSRWQPRGIHDEYWHVHADMNNTAHYHYSGLLYLSTYEQDFTGGRLVFVHPDQDFEALATDPDGTSPVPTHIIEPVAGRVAIFSSGAENPHYVERLQTGERFVLAFWFTCQEARRFEIFLDGQEHYEFSKKVGQSVRNSRARQQKQPPPQEGSEL